MAHPGHLAARRDIFVTPFVSLDTNLPDHFDVGEAQHDLFHAVHLEGAPTAFDNSGTNSATRPPLVRESDHAFGNPRN